MWPTEQPTHVYMHECLEPTLLSPVKLTASTMCTVAFNATYWEAVSVLFKCGILLSVPLELQ